MILPWGIILAKGQLDHSYTFWTMPIMIFSQVYFFSWHTLLSRSIISHQIHQNFTVHTRFVFSRKKVFRLKCLVYWVRKKQQQISTHIKIWSYCKKISSQNFLNQGFKSSRLRKSHFKWQKLLRDHKKVPHYILVDY